MTLNVTELIQELQKIKDQDALVMIWDCETGNRFNIENVDDMENGRIDINIDTKNYKEEA